MTRAAIVALATIVIVAVLVILVAGSYEVPEREQVVVTRFNAPVRVGRKTLSDGKKIRSCRRCNEALD